MLTPIIVVFFLLPVVLGSFAHSLNREKYLRLINIRRSIRSINVIALMVWGTIAIIYIALVTKYLLQEEVRIFTTLACAFLLVCSVCLILTEFPIVQLVKKYNKLLITIVAIISFIVSTISLSYIDGLIINWTGYNISEFTTASAAMSALVVPAFWMIVFWFLMSIVVCYFFLRFLFIAIAYALELFHEGRSFLRLITLNKVYDVKTDSIHKKRMLTGTICIGLYISFLALPKLTFGYLSDEKFNNHLKLVLITMSYHSDSNLCQNVSGEGLRIALLSRDRISIFKDGDNPEFTRGVCEFETSPHIIE